MYRTLGLVLVLAAVAPRQVGASPITPDSDEAAARAALAARLPGAKLVWFRGSDRRGGGDIMFSTIADFAPQKALADSHKYFYPRWSPDGTTILYERANGGIWTMDADFHNHTEIIPNAHTASWTRDGLSVTAIDRTDEHRILIHTLATGETEVLYDSTDPAFAGGFGAGDVLAQAAELRAGGRFLLTFTRDHSHATYIVDLQQRTYLLNDWTEGGNCSPAWAPDGNYIIHTERTSSRPVARSDFDDSAPTLHEADHFLRLADVCECSSYLIHSERVSNDGKWMVVAMEPGNGPQASGKREIWIWEIGTTESTAVRLTFDTLVDYGPSLWVPTSCVDADGDGYGQGTECAAQDCDDTDSEIHPGATEQCNGHDDDCNGATDEIWSTLGESCFAGQGACRRQGSWVCDAAGTDLECDAVAGDPALAEICDGAIDDDCNGSIDDGCPCTIGAEESCYDGLEGTEGVGSCSAGTRACDGGVWSACQGQTLPVPETCNGRDDNCDARVDEDWHQLGELCEDGIGACLDAGSMVCTNDGNGVECDAEAGAPVAEVCDDGIDDDCDGAADNGCGEIPLQLLAPVGGEVWEVGSTRAIRWAASTVDDVALFYSTDGGVSWASMVASIDVSSDQWTSYDWVVPDEPSAECMIRIEDYFREHTQTSQTFAIAAPTTDADLQLIGTMACSSTPPSALFAAVLLLGWRRRRRS